MNLNIQNAAVQPNGSRLVTFDFIRGIAVLGMIFVNVLAFLPDFRVHLLDVSSTGNSYLNNSIFELIFVLFNGKMRALFALLFGAGILLYCNSQNKTTGIKSEIFPRRMVWLLIFGLVHAYLFLWLGSILFEYAICGLLLFSFRHLSASKLFILSALLLTVYIYNNSKDYSETYKMYIGYNEAIVSESKNIQLTEEQISAKLEFEQILENHIPFSQAKTDEIKSGIEENKALYLSNFKEIYSQNTSTSNEALSFGVYLNILESLGTMLLGMFLFKIGFFEFRLKVLYYLIIATLGMSIGALLYIQLYEWQNCTKNELIILFSWKQFGAFAIEGPARIVFAIGYSAFFILLCQLQILRRFISLIASVGKMAFTNYVTQTLIAVIIFYGFELYGRLQIYEYALFALSIIIFQLIISYFWIRYFKTGPLEYLWRKLSSPPRTSD